MSKIFCGKDKGIRKSENLKHKNYVFPTQGLFLIGLYICNLLEPKK